MPPFVERPVAAVLAAMTIAALLWPLFVCRPAERQWDGPAEIAARFSGLSADL